MKCKSLSLTIALLLCLMAIPILLSSTALAGVGCGSNWMGDTTGDTDFWVSKNQNQGGASTSSDGQEAASKPAVALGRAAKANKNATIESISPDKPGPQSPGSVIVWTAAASNPNNEKMLYKFLLAGPATGGIARDQTGWIEGNSWTWTATEADAGENRIEVQVTRTGSAGLEDRRTQSYVIGTSNANPETVAPSAEVSTAPSGISSSTDTSSKGSTSSTTTTSSASAGAASTATSNAEDSHPESRTGEPISDRPRVAPDERGVTAPTTSGPNMQMPDTKPIPLNAPSSGQGIVDAAAASEQQNAVAPEEPKYMEVEGKWTIKLQDSGITLNPLTIIQTDGSVMGMGTLNERSSKIQVSAKGSVSENSMDLDVWTIISEFGNKIDQRITIDLVKVDRTISGSYEMYSGEDLISQGNATATRFAS
jgi:hypothetical protein